MRIILNGKEFNIPSSLNEFTLQQRIDYDLQQGSRLLEMEKSINEMEDGIHKDLEWAQYRFEVMYATFSFFSGVAVEVLKSSEYVGEIASIYYASMAQLFEEPRDPNEIKREFMWQECKWVIQPPEVRHGDRMTFGEMIDAKQIIKDMAELGKGRWEFLLPLCAIYLRKEGEDYDESFLYEDSERLELMKTLPIDIAIHIGFFLNDTQLIYLKTSQFSEKAA